MKKMFKLNIKPNFYKINIPANLAYKYGYDNIHLNYNNFLNDIGLDISNNFKSFKNIIKQDKQVMCAIINALYNNEKFPKRKSGKVIDINKKTYEKILNELRNIYILDNKNNLLVSPEIAKNVCKKLIDYNRLN